MSYTGEKFLHERVNAAYERLSALEDRVSRLSAIAENMEAIVKIQRERPSECFKCSRDPQEVHECSDEHCPLGKHKF